MSATLERSIETGSLADFLVPMTLHEARRIMGASLNGGKNARPGAYNSPFSKTSKMPCLSYNLPASACNVGSRLSLVPDSTCYECYAKEGSYLWTNTLAAMARHLEAIKDPRFVEAAVFLIGRLKNSHFRWLDSGDLQSLDMLEKIVAIAEQLEEITFWLPTRERKIVREFEDAGGVFPKNLRVRLSMPMQNMSPPAAGIAAGRNYSMTHTNPDTLPAEAIACPAAERSAAKLGGECGDCRACWSDAPIISYRMH